MMSNPPAREHGGHLVGRAGHFPWATAGREVDVATRELVEKPGVMLVGHIVDRVIEVEVVVVPPMLDVARLPAPTRAAVDGATLCHPSDSRCFFLRFAVKLDFDMSGA